MKFLALLTEKSMLNPALSAKQICCFVPFSGWRRTKLSNSVGLTDENRQAGRQALAASLSSAVSAYQSADDCLRRNGSDKFKCHIFRTLSFSSEQLNWANRETAFRLNSLRSGLFSRGASAVAQGFTMAVD